MSAEQDRPSYTEINSLFGKYGDAISARYVLMLEKFGYARNIAELIISTIITKLTEFGHMNYGYPSVKEELEVIASLNLICKEISSRAGSCRYESLLRTYGKFDISETPILHIGAGDFDLHSGLALPGFSTDVRGISGLHFRSSASALPLRDGSSTPVIIDCLHHLNGDRDHAMAELARVVSSNGRIFISEIFPDVENYGNDAIALARLCDYISCIFIHQISEISIPGNFFTQSNFVETAISHGLIAVDYQGAEGQKPRPDGLRLTYVLEIDASSAARI